MEILMTILIIGLCIFGLILIRIVYENKCVITTEYSINLKGLHKDKSIVFISDFHSHKSFDFRWKVLEAIKKTGTDTIIICGDMIIGKPNKDSYPAIQFIKELSKKYKVYFTYGNHESRMFTRNIEDKQDFFGEIKKIDNLTILNNESTSININNMTVNLYGLELEDEFYKKKKCKVLDKEHIQSVLGEKKTGFSILIAHKPDFFDAYSGYGADLIISGHNHGGTIRLPGMGGLISTSFKLFPDYCYGSYYLRNSRMIVSSGLGGHSIKVRLFNKPEIVCLNFKGNKKLNKKK